MGGEVCFFVEGSDAATSESARASDWVNGGGDSKLGIEYACDGPTLGVSALEERSGGQQINQKKTPSTRL